MYKRYQSLDTIPLRLPLLKLCYVVSYATIVTCQDPRAWCIRAEKGEFPAKGAELDTVQSVLSLESCGWTSNTVYCYVPIGWRVPTDNTLDPEDLRLEFSISGADIKSLERTKETRHCRNGCRACKSVAGARCRMTLLKLGAGRNATRVCPPRCRTYSVSHDSDFDQRLVLYLQRRKTETGSLQDPES